MGTRLRIKKTLGSSGGGGGGGYSYSGGSSKKSYSSSSSKKSSGSSSSSSSKKSTTSLGSYSRTTADNMAKKNGSVTPTKKLSLGKGPISDSNFYSTQAKKNTAKEKKTSTALKNSSPFSTKKSVFNSWF